MKIVIAPDSFKESLSAAEIARQIENGFKEVFPTAEYYLRPMADGGEGTVAALVAATGGEVRHARVSGPLGAAVDAFYGVCGDGRTAVIEMAAASGLALLAPDLRNPLLTSSYGTGELIRRALDDGLRNLIIGLGGSATNDAGAGMLQALGARFFTAGGEELAPGGGALAGLEHIDIGELDPRLKECTIEVACDVDNPLTGARGASAVFGPQKGATPEMVAQLDKNLAHFAERATRVLGRDTANYPGAGAAGGLGYALLAFLNADLRPGVGIVMDALRLKELLAEADLVITGEGRIDGQSLGGKVPIGVARLAAEQGVPAVALAGSLGAGSEAVYDHGIQALFSVVSGPCTLADALANASENVQRTARNVATLLKLAQV
ncbi:MAG: glycerate kinase [Desulfuromonas sp.]|nr:MAG: glycerate kinase [Desulfuromonas sp.]